MVKLPPLSLAHTGQIDPTQDRAGAAGHQTDPQEMVNLAGRPNQVDTAAVLSGLLHDRVRRARRAPLGVKQINQLSSQKSGK
jgi:hypothetical protein